MDFSTFTQNNNSGSLNLQKEGSTIKKSIVQDSTIKFNSTVENSTLNHAEFSEPRLVSYLEPNQLKSLNT